MRRRLALCLLTLAACARPLPAASPPPAEPAPTPRAAFVIPDAQATAPPSPIALTSSDGTGLALESLTAHTKVRGPLAYTEVHLVFRNPTERQLEGRFRMALPPGAFLSRLAMKIDGTFREADVVELPVARDVYEETMHRRRDPLLVEQKTDNEVSARVFPIPASGTKEIVVGWIAEGAASVPMRGLPAVPQLIVTADPPAPGDVAVRSGDDVAVRVRVPGTPTVAPVGAGIVVLLDTSASRAPELDADLRLLRATVAELAKAEPDARLVVVAFDQTPVTSYDGTLRTFGDEAVRRIKTRGALGASDLGAAIGHGAREASRIGATRALLVGEGVASAGTADRWRLRDATRALKDAGVERLDAIATGEVRDEPLLRSLATGMLPKAGTLARSEDAPSRVASALRTEALRAGSIAIDGATWSTSADLAGALPGDERVLYAELRRGTPLRVAGKTLEAVVTDELASRAVAKARVDAKVEHAENGGWTDAESDAVIALAKKHRVPSPLTAMIVVESDADREALLARRPPPKTAPPAPPATPRSGGAHKTSAPQLRMGSVTVNGRLPAEVVQRIVRQNFGRFRACYEDGLRRNPKLGGRVATKFTIQRDGSVGVAMDAGSEITDGAMLACVQDGFRRLVFPEPEGGVITVVYPIVFRPLDEGEEIEPPAPVRASVWSAPFRVGSSWAPPPPPPPIAPWRGTFAGVELARIRGEREEALSRAAAFHAEDARDPIALVALGDAALSASMPELAARAYGSIADLYPHRADMLRASAARLESIGELPIAIELFRRAAADRPDQPSSHHLLAMALVEAGRNKEALEVLRRAMDVPYPSRHLGARNLFRHEIAALEGAIGRPTRLVAATWESDASRVELQVDDAREHLSWATDGFGPSAVLVDASVSATTAPRVHFLVRGPSNADALGVVHVMEDDGRGHVSVHTRPFVLQNEGGTLALDPVNPSSGSR